MKMLKDEYRDKDVSANKLRKICLPLFLADRKKTYTTSICNMFYYRLHEIASDSSLKINLDEMVKDVRTRCRSLTKKYSGKNSLITFYQSTKIDEKSVANLKSLVNLFGIYYLYDKDKNLIYIGKSEHLGKRIITSYEYREAKYYKYSVLNNKSDMHILEIYLIAKYKPEKNADCKSLDIPTLTIDEPKKTTKFYSIKYLVSRLEKA